MKFNVVEDALAWGNFDVSDPDNKDTSWSYVPLTGNFTYIPEDDSELLEVTGVPLIVTAAGFTPDASNSRIFRTPEYTGSTRNAEREKIEVIGSYP